MRSSITTGRQTVRGHKLRLSYLLKHVLSSHLTVLFRGTVGWRCVCLLCVAVAAAAIGRWYR